jgi:propanol-preferring alcohol dehydrogenase
VQLGREWGADVIAVDVSEDKLELANSLGAISVLNTATTNVVKELRGKGGVHVALVTAAAKAAYDTAFGCLRPTGTLLVVGLPSENLSFPAILMAAGEVHIQASAVGTRQDLREVLALGAAGKLSCHVTAHPLGDINGILEQLRHGQISGRTAIVSS